MFILSVLAFLFVPVQCQVTTVEPSTGDSTTINSSTTSTWSRINGADRPFFEFDQYEHDEPCYEEFMSNDKAAWATCCETSWYSENCEVYFPSDPCFNDILLGHEVTFVAVEKYPTEEWHSCCEAMCGSYHYEQCDSNYCLPYENHDHHDDDDHDDHDDDDSVWKGMIIALGSLGGFIIIAVTICVGCGCCSCCSRKKKTPVINVHDVAAYAQAPTPTHAVMDYPYVANDDDAQRDIQVHHIVNTNTIL